VFSSAWGGGDDVHQGVIPGLDLAVAVVSVAAFALFAAVVRGVSRSQETLAVQPARR
jgi:hypothetical protein